MRLLNIDDISSSDFSKLKKLIKSNNQINLDIVNPSNWKITNNLSEVMTILYSCFKESL